MLRYTCTLLAVSLGITAAPPPQSSPNVLPSQEAERLFNEAQQSLQDGHPAGAMPPLMRVRSDVSRRLAGGTSTALPDRLGVRTKSGVLRALQDARAAYQATDWSQARQHLAAALMGLASLERAVPPRQRYEHQYENARREVDGADRFNTVALLRAAQASLEAARHGEAIQFADRYNERARELFVPAVAGDLVHQGHTVAGLAALRMNDLLEARRRLIESAAVESGALVQAMGPSMALAQALLAHGERAVVLDYLTRCAKLTWSEGAALLPEWRRQIEQGQTPDFGKHALWL